MRQRDRTGRASARGCLLRSRKEHRGRYFCGAFTNGPQQQNDWIQLKGDPSQATFSLTESVRMGRGWGGGMIASYPYLAATSRFGFREEPPGSAISSRYVQGSDALDRSHEPWSIFCSTSAHAQAQKIARARCHVSGPTGLRLVLRTAARLRLHIHTIRRSRKRFPLRTFAANMERSTFGTPSRGMRRI